MKLYYLLGDILRPFAAVGFYLYNFVFRTPRTRVVLKNEEGEILLLQTWLSGDTWGLPGGGVKRNEPIEASAIRELREETGIVLSSDSLQFQFAFTTVWHEEEVYLVELSDAVLPSSLPNTFEVKAAKWFSAQRMPKLEPVAQEVINRMEI